MPLDNERKDTDQKEPTAFVRLLSEYEKNPTVSMNIMLRIIIGSRSEHPLNRIINKLKEEFPDTDFVDDVELAIKKYEG